MAASSSRTYLWRLGGIVAFALVATFVINAVVDPYAMTGWIDKEGFNSHKTELVERLRIGKPLAIMRRQPKFIVLGISREARGFDLGSDAFASLPTPRYNLSLDSGHIGELRDFFEHATNVAPIEEMVLGLDFSLMFNARSPSALHDPRLLLADGGSRSVVYWRALQYLLSFETLRDSIRTVRAEGDSVREFDDFGSRTEFALEQQRRNAGGHRNMFRYSERRQYFDNEMRALVGGPFTTQRGDYSTLDDLAALLDRARRRGVRVHLVIPPVHARQLEVYRLLGLWPAFEQWKTEVLAAAASAGYPVWDFATYDPLTWEAVPAEGDKTSAMRFYWESSHFNRALGDRVIQRILGGGTENFGVRLSVDNLAAHLASVRARGVDYRNANAGDVAELRTMLCAAYRDAKAQRPGLDPGVSPTLQNIMTDEAKCL